jgi:hypothetical protein
VGVYQFNKVTFPHEDEIEPRTLSNVLEAAEQALEEGDVV